MNKTCKKKKQSLSKFIQPFPRPVSLSLSLSLSPQTHTHTRTHINHILCTNWHTCITHHQQWPIGYGVELRIKRSSVRIRPWPLRWVLGQGSLLPLSQGEAFTLASIGYLAILVKYILAKKKSMHARTHTYSTQTLKQKLKAESLSVCPSKPA